MLSQRVVAAVCLLLATACSPVPRAASGPLRSVRATVRLIAPGQALGAHQVQYQVELSGWPAGCRIEAISDDQGPLEFRLAQPTTVTNPATRQLTAWRFVPSPAVDAPVEDRTHETPPAASPAPAWKAGTFLTIAYHTNRAHVLRISTLERVDGPAVP